MHQVQVCWGSTCPRANPLLFAEKIKNNILPTHEGCLPCNLKGVKITNTWIAKQWPKPFKECAASFALECWKISFQTFDPASHLQKRHFWQIWADRRPGETTQNLLVKTMDKVHQHTTWIWWCHEGKPWKRFIGSGFKMSLWNFWNICMDMQWEAFWTRHPSPKKKKLGLAHALQSTLPLEQLQRAVCLINIFKIFLQKPVSVSKNSYFCRKILAASGYNQLPYLVSLVLQSIQICRLFFDLGVVNHICELFLRSIQETPLLTMYRPTHALLR